MRLPALLLLSLTAHAVQAASASSPAALPTADDALERSLAHHDPENVWSSHPIEITAEVQLTERLASERGYASRTDRIRLDVAAQRFLYRSTQGEESIEIVGDHDVFSARLNGSWDISDEERERHGLAPDRLPRWRDYFAYMYGMPMKLRDPGTRLDPEVERTELAGREVLALRVTYAPEVGSDVWYFYLDPETFALVGCRFYHDESANDGEYLLFEGEVQGPNGLRLPRLRRWYMNRDGEQIATDDVISIE